MGAGTPRDELVEDDPVGDTLAVAARWVSWRVGSSAATWSHNGSRMQDGRAGTGHRSRVWWHMPEFRQLYAYLTNLTAPTPYWRSP